MGRKLFSIYSLLAACMVCLSSAIKPELTPSPKRACEDAGFRHPGLLSSANDLEFLRTQVTNNTEPWATAYRYLREGTLSGQRIGELSYTPTAIKVVDAGPTGDGRNDDIERRDATAAYNHALQWVVSQDERHAEKAIEILNTWAYNYESRVQSINRTLSVGWSAPIFMRAAEIIRYTYTKYKAEDIQALAVMMRDKMLPLVYNGARTTAGNWETSMAEAVLSIGVFLDDREVFNQGLNLIRRKIPEYVYIVEDGQWPVLPPQKAQGDDVTKYLFWYRGGNPDGIAKDPPPNYNLPFRFHDGQSQETCRDMNHTQLGLGAALNCLEIAYTQGIDLYATYQDRMVRAMEFNSKVMIDIEDGRGVPADLCGGIIALAATRFMGFEIGYNHYHHRLKIAMPFTEEFIKRTRKARFRYNPILHLSYPAFTHEQLVLAKPVPVNEPPANFTLSIAGGTEPNTAILQWTPSVDHDGGLAGYSIYEDTSRIAEVLTSVTRYELSDLVEGNSYRYFVAARDSCGNVTNSNEVAYFVTEKPAAEVEAEELAIAPRKIFSRSRDQSWAIAGIDACTDCAITIFTRSGVKVFETQRYTDSPWNGTFNGASLNSGVYSYVIKRNGTRVKTGTITLIE